MQGEGWAEGASWIKGGAGEWAGNEYADGDGQAHGESGDGTGIGAFVDDCGKHDEDQEKRGGGFESHAGPAGIVAQELGHEVGGVAPGFVGNYDFEQKRGGRSAEELRGPV